MPKLKSHRGAAKRFKRCGGKSSRKIKHKQSHARHILTKKSANRKRHLRGLKVMAVADANRVDAMLRGSD